MSEREIESEREKEREREREGERERETETPNKKDEIETGKIRNSQRQLNMEEDLRVSFFLFDYLFPDSVISFDKSCAHSPRGD